MIYTTTRVLQINLNRSQAATENALQLAIEYKVDILFIQEPWIFQSEVTRSISHQSFSQIFPLSDSAPQLRPRVLAYIAKSYSPLVTISPLSPKDPDLLILDITEKGRSFSVYNTYNQVSQQEGTSLSTFSRVLQHLPINPESIILGDFNLHHYLWDSTITSTSRDSDDFVQWIEEKSLSLINEPNQPTFFRPHMNQGSTIDLTLSTFSITIQDWQLCHEIGSDHFGILFTIPGSTDLIDSPFTTLPRFNTKLAD